MSEPDICYNLAWHNGRIMPRATETQTVKIDLADVNRLDDVHRFLLDMPSWLQGHPKQIDVVGHVGTANVVADVLRKVHPTAAVTTKLLA